MKKKVLTLALALLFVMPLMSMIQPALSVVGAEDGSDKEPITITLVAQDIFTFDPETDPIAKEIVDRFNITFENVTYSDSEAKLLEAQSGTLADVLYSASLYDLYGFNLFITNDFYRSIPEEISSKFPRIKEQLENDEVASAVREHYGADFYLPKPDSLDPNIYIGERKGIFYRKDWAENLGIEEPTTWEELYEMARAFTEDDPDGNGVDDTFGLTTDGFGNLRYFLSNVGHSNMNWVKGPDDIWTHGALLEDNIPVLEMFREMYENNYIDSEFAVTDYQQSMQKFASGRFGMLNRNADADWIRNVVVDTFWAANPDVEDPFEIIGLIPALALDDESPVMMEKYIDSMCATHFASHLSDEKLERYLEFHEWCMSEEGDLLRAVGYEGEDWEYDGDTIVKIRDENGLAPNLQEKYPSRNTLTMPSWGFHNNSDPLIETFDFFNDEIKELDAYARSIRNENVVESDMRVKLISAPEVQLANSFGFSNEYSNIITGTEPVADLFAEMKERAMIDGFEEAMEVVNQIAEEKGW